MDGTIIDAFDAHNHIGIDEVYGFSQSPVELLKKMDKAQVEKAVIFPFASVSNRMKDNAAVARAVSQHPKRFIGFFCINPRVGTTYSEVKAAREKQGLKGVLLDLPAFTNWIAESIVSAVFEMCSDLQLPIMLHTYPNLFDIAAGLDAILQRNPSVSVITNMRVPAISLVLARNKNLYLDTAYMYDVTPLYFYVRNGYGSRLLFGSHSPLGHPYVERKKIDIVDESTAGPINPRAVVTPYHQQLILRDNLTKLLKLE